MPVKKKFLSESKKNHWKELTTQKDKFIELIRILNQFYDKLDIDHSPSHKFRKDLALQEPKNLEIFFRKFGRFEYLVAVTIKEDPGKTRQDTWIHVDGVEEERKLLKKRGIENHPIFDLTNLTDLFRVAKKTNLDFKKGPNLREQAE